MSGEFGNETGPGRITRKQLTQKKKPGAHKQDRTVLTNFPKQRFSNFRPIAWATALTRSAGVSSPFESFRTGVKRPKRCLAMRPALFGA